MRALRCTLHLLTALLLGATANAQEEPPVKFEVASIRQHLIPEGMVRRAYRPNIDCAPIAHCGVSGNRFTEELASLVDLMMDAYAVQRHQVIGLPDWGDSGKDIYDIAATIPGEPPHTQAQARRMLQSLLAERFQLRIHRESRQLPVYVLSIGKSGSKLTKVPTEDAKPEDFLRNWEIIPEALSMLAERPVIDKTGLEGSYTTRDGYGPLEGLDIGELMRSRNTSGDAATPGSSLFDQVEKYWGMKLEAQKGPVDVIVIDHVERPSAN